PGPYGQQPPYGGPQGPGGFPPPPPAPKKSKAGWIIGGVAAVVAIAVGAYFVIGGGGGSSVADDGPHKLITPETVLTEYKKGADGGSKNDDDDFIKDAEKNGVKNGKNVTAQWEVKDPNNPLGSKLLQFGGVYGQIDDPEKTLDGIFAGMRAEASKKKDDKAELVGEPKQYEPAELDGALLKCQEIKSKADGSNPLGAKEFTMPVCVWADHSTVGYVMPMDLASLMAGKSSTAEDAASIAAKLRKEVRVKL
ncbi:hypothetical protein GT043_18540, partial [Streptomyces sp. SID2131]|nr:hypothetical protein [Streptomyces sp. SID2131]